MDVKKGQIAELWNGDFGEVLEVVGSKAHLLLEKSGKRSWESMASIVDAVDTFTEKEAKFLQGKDRLAEYKKKTTKEKTAVAPPGWEGTVKKMKEHEDEIDNPWALAWYMKNKGYKPSAGSKEITAACTEFKKIAQYPDKPGWYVYDKKTGEVVAEGLDSSEAASDKIGEFYAQYDAKAEFEKPNYKKSYSSEASKKTAAEGDLVLVRMKEDKQHIQTPWFLGADGKFTRNLDKAKRFATEEEALAERKSTSIVPEEQVFPASYFAKAASKKEAGLPDDYHTKYKVDDILVPADDSDNTDQVHVLGVNQEEKAYILEKRPMADENPDPDSQTYGVRYEVAFNTLDNDKSLKLFASIDFAKGCPANMVSISTKKGSVALSSDKQKVTIACGTIDVSFEDSIDAAYDTEGNLLSTNATEEQFSPEFRKEFGLMIKNIGVEKLSSMLAQKRIATKVRAMDGDDREIQPAQDNMLDFSGVAGDMRAVIDGDTVKFYDLRYPHTPDGQFISSYYVSTLLEDPRLKDSGLNLDAGIPDWGIDAPEMTKVYEWLESKTNAASTKTAGAVVFDNEGKTADRYTIVDEATGDIYGADENPYNPQGFGQFAGNVNDPSYESFEDAADYIRQARDMPEWIGKEVTVESLPEKTQQYVREMTASKKTAQDDDRAHLYDRIDKMFQIYRSGAPMDDETFAAGAEAIKEIVGEVAWEEIRRMATKYNVEPSTALGQEIINEYEFYATEIEWKEAGVELSRKAFKKVSSLKKKADRLGDYDFDVHGDETWKLEAGDDGKKKLMRVNK